MHTSLPGQVPTATAQQGLVGLKLPDLTKSPPYANDNQPLPKLRSHPIGRTDLPNLANDIARLVEIPFNTDYDEYAVGPWQSLALYNRDGDANSSASHEYEGSGAWTRHGHALAEVKALVEAVFKFDTLRSVRIFATSSGGMIRPHRDYIEFGAGFTRLHLVLKTNPLAMNGEGRVAFHMAPGSLWYLDGREPHWAVNFSPEPRYHVVCDFPAGSAAEACISGKVVADRHVAYCEREEIPADFSALLALASRSATVRAMDELLDLVDRLFVRYDCGSGTPYDLVLPHLGNNVACIKHLIERRAYFLGF